MGTKGKAKVRPTARRSQAPRLTIQLVKRPGKTGLLRCVRADGSETMAEMIAGAEHDLAHHAVETTLGLDDAFYGMLARGMRIQDFDVTAATTKIDIPANAIHVEFVVAVLQAERRQGEAFAEFRAELERSYAAARRPPPTPGPVLTDPQIATMRERLEALMRRWVALPANTPMELTFPS